MKIKIRLHNQSGKEILLRFEPIGDYAPLLHNEDGMIEIEVRKEEGILDLIVEKDANSITLVENNSIWIERLP